MFDENFIKEQAEIIMDIQKKAYQAGFEAGYKQKERELLGRTKKEFEVMSPKDLDNAYPE